MAGFFVSLSNTEISRQIADMINKYNKWYISFSATAIFNIPVNYFVEIYGDKVVGCAGVSKSGNTYKIQHVCVLPEFRGRGIAAKLIKIIVDNHRGDVYTTVRADNANSLSLFRSAGFKYVRKTWSVDHWTYVLDKRLDRQYNMEGNQCRLTR